ncbi:MAG: GtrA family protein [Pseudomonadota bacterium]
MGPRFLKFATVGGVTTFFGIALYALLLLFFQVNLFAAYILVFVASVTLSYALNARFNYQVPWSFGSYARFMSSYGVGFAVGFILITIMKAATVPLSDFWIAMAAIPLRFVVTFLFADRAMAAHAARKT